MIKVPIREKRVEGTRHNQTIRALGRHPCPIIIKMHKDDSPIGSKPDPKSTFRENWLFKIPAECSTFVPCPACIASAAQLTIAERHAFGSCQRLPIRLNRERLIALLDTIAPALGRVPSGRRMDLSTSNRKEVEEMRNDHKIAPWSHRSGLQQALNIHFKRFGIAINKEPPQIVWATSLMRKNINLQASGTASTNDSP